MNNDEELLSLRFARAAEAMPRIGTSYEAVLRKARHRQRWTVVRVALAGAAATSALFMGPGLLERAREQGEVPKLGSAAPSGTTEHMEPEAEVVARWIAAIYRGDTRTAWDLLGPASRSSAANYRFFAQEAKHWADGIGTWATLGEVRYEVSPVVSSGDGRVSVVTMYEPATGRSAALVVRENADGMLVEHLPGGDGSAFIDLLEPDGPPGPVSLDQAPEPAAGAPEGQTFKVEVAAHAEVVQFEIISTDDQASRDIEVPTTSERFSYIEWTPKRRLDSGVHVIMAYVLHSDGGIAATSAGFVIP
jgi:hypothetical protein